MAFEDEEQQPPRGGRQNETESFPNDDRKTVRINILPRMMRADQGVTVAMTPADESNGDAIAPVDDVEAVARIRANSQGDRYERGAVIAEGGMGAVIEARDKNLDRRIAMKVLRPSRRANRDDILRFIAEACVTSQIEHPSIVPVHELAVDASGNVFYTMKLLEGKTLADLLKGIREGDSAIIKAYPLSHLLTIFQKVCDAVAFAHSKHVIHRDLKPDNVMIGEYGEVQVMDWGLAKKLGTSEPGGEWAADAALTLPELETMFPLRTIVGTIMGTPGYMAPEQASGDLDNINERSDIYSLGAILYDILTLQPPVEGKKLTEVLTRIKSGAILPPTEVSTRRARDARQPATEAEARKELGALRHLPDGRIPASLSAVAMKALSLKPHERYRNVREFQREIEAYQNGFATGAEEAGVWRQAVLFVRRNRGASLATGVALVVLIVVVAAAWRINFNTLKEKARKEREAVAAVAERERAAEAAKREALEQQLVASATAARLKKEEHRREQTWIPVYDGDFATETNLSARFETFYRDAKDLFNPAVPMRQANDMAKVVGPCLVLTNSSGLVMTRWKGKEDAGDDVQFDCEISGSNSVGIAVGGDTFTGYRAVYDAQANSIVLDTLMASVWKTLAGNRQPLKPPEERRLIRVEKSGSTIRVWVDQDLVIDYFDPLIRSGPGQRTFALSAFYTKAVVYGIQFCRRRSPEVVSCLESAREFMRRRQPGNPNDSRLADANDFLQAQIQTHGDSEVGTEAKLLLALCLQYQNKTSEALKVLQSVTRFDPDNLLTEGFPRLRAAAFQQISLIHLAANRFREAAQAAREACLLDPGSFAGEQIHQALLTALRRPGIPRQDQVEILNALGRLPLSKLVLPRMEVGDLSPLKSMSLISLNVSELPVEDLSPLADMHLNELQFNPTRVKKGWEGIRDMTTLETINALPAETFWQKFDAGEFKKK